MSKKKIKYEECPRCSGTKVFPEYLHIAEGKCFRCGGKGKVPITTVFETFTSVEALLKEAKRLKIQDKYGFLDKTMDQRTGLKILANHGIRAWLAGSKLNVYNFAVRDY